MNDLSKLHPFMQEKAKMLIQFCYLIYGAMLDIYSTRRTFAEQQKEWIKGRDAKGNIIKPKYIVTYARPGYSYHNYGLAIDAALLNKKGQIDWADNAMFEKMGHLAKLIGMEWGGDFIKNGKPFPDRPHIQITGGKTTAQLFKGEKPVFPSIQDEYKKYAPIVFGANYKAEINRLKKCNDSTRFWEIPILETLRLEKLKNQKSIKKVA